MDLSAISSINNLNALNLNGTAGLSATSLTGMLLPEQEKAEGTLFEAFLNSAIDNITTTNGYLSNAEDEKLKFALGETDNTHDLTIAMQKASTTLQYTVAVKNKLLEAYKEIMQIQI